MSEANLSLKVLINKHKSKVMFAEANNHVVDVLFSFLALPLGKIVRIFEKHYGNEAPVIGSLTTLYKGLLNLDVDNFSCKGAKGMLVDPKSSLEGECRRLKLDITDSQPPAYFVCQNLRCDFTGPGNISLFPDVMRCTCGKMLSTKITVGECLEGVAEFGIFTRNAPDSFIISDDLRVSCNSTGIVQTFNNLGITDTDGEDMRSLSLGIRNIMDLLKCALISTTPLTDLFINSGEIRPSPAESQPGIEKETVSDDAKNMILKVSLQKSTNKFLYANGKGDFVELLFSFLTIPLGGVESLLKGKTGLKNIDNLYKSVSDSDGIERKYFVNRNLLINPNLAPGYCAPFQLLPLVEECPRELYWYQNESSLEYGGVFSHYPIGSKVNYSPGGLCFVDSAREYIVSDDLSVAPYSVAAIVSILNAQGVSSLLDVREVELNVGVEEALSILKTSLTSTTALTDALNLIDPMLKIRGRVEEFEDSVFDDVII